MRWLIVVAIILLLVVVTYVWAGDIKHPSLPRAVHNGEPCLFGQAACGGSGGGGGNPTPVPGQPFVPGTINTVSNVLYATDPLFGAVGDAIYSGDGSHQSDGSVNHTSTFSSPSGNFQTYMVGDLIYIDGAGLLGVTYQGTVSAITNNSTMTVSPVPPVAVTNAHYVIGHDNTAALQQWINVMKSYPSPNQPKGYLPFGVYLHRSLDFSQTVNLNIEGAGMGQDGGSTLLCMGLATSVCHDFSGAIGDKIQDLSMWAGSGTAQESAATNILLADLPSTAVSNDKFVDVNFRSNGTYNVGLYGAQTVSFIDDVFNFAPDVAKALYISSANTPSWVSPTRGALATAPAVSNGVGVIGSKSFLMATGNSAITLDEGAQAQKIDNIKVDGATIVLNNAATGIADTCTTACTLFNAALENLSFNNINWQVSDAASRLVSVQGAAVNWSMTGYTSFAVQPTNTLLAFVNGFYSSNLVLELPTVASNGVAIGSPSCKGSTLQLGQGTPIAFGCSTSASTVTTSAGTLNLNLYPVTGIFNGNAGTASCAQPFQGQYKLVTCALSGYQRTSAAQVYGFTSAFSINPILIESGCGTVHSTATTTQLTLPADPAMTPETCNITVTGQ